MTTVNRGFIWSPWRTEEIQEVVNVFQANPKTTTREVAEKLGVSKRTVNRMIAYCKQKFKLPRINKTKWTKELIQEAIDYQEREYERRIEIIRYGECPTCGETGKNARQRKQTEKGYRTLYKTCSKCDTLYGFKIEGDSPLDRRVETVDKLTAAGFFKHGYISIVPDFEDNLTLAKSIMKKLKKGEYVPGDQLNMVSEWLDEE